MFIRILQSRLVLVGSIFLAEGVIGVLISKTRYAQLGNVGPAFVSEWERNALSALFLGGWLLAMIGLFALLRGVAGVVIASRHLKENKNGRHDRPSETVSGLVVTVIILVFVLIVGGIGLAW